MSGQPAMSTDVSAQIAAVMESQRQALYAELDLQHAAMQQCIERACSSAMLEQAALTKHLVEEMRNDTCEEKEEEEEERELQKGRPQQQPLEESEQFPSFESFASDERPVRGVWTTISEGNSQKKSGPIKTLLRKKSHAVDKKVRELNKLMHDGSSATPNSFRGRLDLWIRKRLDLLSGILIVANAFVMFLHMELLGQHASIALGYEAAIWPSADRAFIIVEMCFCTLFAMELGLRIFVYRLDFFRRGFNILDLVVVPLMALDSFFIGIVEDASGGNLNASFLRVLRFVRNIRAARVVRTLGRFRQLRILWNTVVASLWSLVYSMAMMLVFVVMLALFLTQALHLYIMDESNDLQTREWINRMYGNGVRSVWTVFELTFSGGWPNYVRPIIESVSPWYAIVFAAYVATVVFAMTRIVSALFLRETLQQASDEAELMVRERARDTIGLDKNLHAFFRAADKNNDGLLTPHEMIQVLAHDRMKLWLGRLGIDASDAHGLFRLLDVGNESGVACDAFVYGIKRLKGEARAQDLVPVMNDIKKILIQCTQLHLSCSQIQGQLQRCGVGQPEPFQPQCEHESMAL